MEHFELHGTWWLPDEPAHRVAGTLTYDEAGVRLLVHDALRRFELPREADVHFVVPERAAEPVIHGLGETDEAITVFDAEAVVLRGPFDTVREDYRAGLVLRGCHSASAVFAEALISFDLLDQWAHTPSIQMPTDDRAAVAIRLDVQELGRAALPDGTELHLLCGVEGTAGGEMVRLDRWTAFRITAATPLIVSQIMEDFVRPLHDFLVLCLGLPIRLRSLAVRPTDQGDHREGCYDAYLRRVQPLFPGHTPLIDGYTAPTLLKLENAGLPFAELLARWWELWPTWQTALELLLEPLYAPFIYGRHAYASTFQSAEALHRLLELEGTELDRTAHRERVERVISVLERAGLDDEDAVWARRVLQERNDKRLRDKMDEVLAAAGAVGEAVQAACPDFASRAVSARTGVSHGGASRRGGEEHRFWLMRTLRWVVRTVLLGDLTGNPEAVQQRVLKRHPFKRDVAALVDAVQRLGT